jgi:hypothetical protein
MLFCAYLIAGVLAPKDSVMLDSQSDGSVSASSDDESDVETFQPPLVNWPDALTEAESKTEYQQRSEFKRLAEEANPRLRMTPLPVGCWRYGGPGQASGSGAKGISGTNKPAPTSYVLFHCACMLFLEWVEFAVNEDGAPRRFFFTVEDIG